MIVCLLLRLHALAPLVHSKSQLFWNAVGVLFLEAKAEAAKKRARDGFGEGDGDWMESDPDRHVGTAISFGFAQVHVQERAIQRRTDGILL